MSIEFNFQKKAVLPQKRNLKKFLYYLFENESRALDTLSFVFCEDKFLLDINTQYLKHKDLTDVITFDLRISKFDPILGEIYISIDRVKENASTYNQSFIKELHRVMIHGALHLCGYCDKTFKEKKTIRIKEDFYLLHYSTMFHVEL